MSVLSFPLSREDFMDRLLINKVVFDLPDQNEVSGLGSGGVIQSEVRPRMWVGEIGLSAKDWITSDKMAALIRVLRAPGATFLAYDVRHMWPASDPGGQQLVGASPKIAALHADNNQLSISGLPARYRLQIGDRLSFWYQDAASTDLVALHEVVSVEVNASTGGLTPYFQVQPEIRPGARVGADVELVKPYCKAIIDPKSGKPGEGRKMKTSGAGFKFTQQLR